VGVLHQYVGEGGRARAKKENGQQGKELRETKSKRGERERERERDREKRREKGERE